MSILRDWLVWINGFRWHLRWCIGVLFIEDIPVIPLTVQFQFRSTHDFDKRFPQTPRWES